MKTLLSFIFLSFFLGLQAKAEINDSHCEIKRQQGKQKLYTCRFPWTKKELLVLDLYGKTQDTAYYHGLFLRKEIEEGILAGVAVETRRSLATLSAEDRKRFEKMSRCVLNRYQRSTSSDLSDIAENMTKGMQDSGGKTKKQDLLDAYYMVDLSIWFDAITRKMDRDPGAAKREIIRECGTSMVFQGIGGFLKKVAHGLERVKFGCTGVASSAAHSMDNALVLGRNFDTGLLGFFETHQLILIQNNPNGIRNVGIASAGMHFAGGISGFNNKGLVASLHQLQTENTVTKYLFNQSESTPYLLHKVLNEATTLDEAIKLIKDTKGFGAWTIFIGDSKTDEIASIEMAGDRVVVARRVKNKFMAQSNHYLSSEMQKDGFEYSLNKTLESRARLSLVDHSLKNAPQAVDAEWAINMLSGHNDYLVGKRSFGRTTTKVYTAATHVMVPARQELWMSFGDLYPTNRNPFIGVRILPNNSFEFIDAIEPKKDLNRDSWYKSMGEYVAAYLKNEDNTGSVEQSDLTLKHLDHAIALAQEDNIVELPYHYIRARVLINKGALLDKKGMKKEAHEAYQLAYDDLIFLKEAEKNTLIRTHLYESGLVNLWLARSIDLLGRTRLERAPFEKEARGFFEELLKTYAYHQDFSDLTKKVPLLFTPDLALKEPLRFGTIE